MPIEYVTIGGSCLVQTIDPTGEILASFTNYPTARSYYQDKTPGSAPKQPDGWRAPTNYSILCQAWTRASGVAIYRYNGGANLTKYTGDELHGDYIAELPTFPNGLRQQAEVDALSKLKDQSVNLALAFAERDQLANLVGTTASRIARAYRYVRKGDFRKASHELGKSWKKSTRSWLELQYAWKPLLGDVHGSVKELQGTDLSQWLVTVKGKKSSREVIVRDSVTTASVPMQMIVKVFQGSFVRLDYHPTDGFMNTLTRLGLTNPAVLAWELLPYSFVVDWFWPVGDWLNVLDATAGFNFTGGSYSNVTRSELRSVSLGKMTPPSILVSNRMEGGRGRSICLNRTRYTSSPLPRPPGLKNPVSLGHMANGLSLLAEAFGRGR